VCAAAAAATRSPLRAIRERSPARRLFCLLAREVGHDDSALLARLCGISAEAVRKHWSHPDPRALAAALLCLGDKRLIPPPGWFFDADPPPARLDSDSLRG